MINKHVKRALAATTGVGLAFAGLVGIATPAQALDCAAGSTKFTMHLNVPSEVSADWNIWYWGTGVDGVGPQDNTIGESTHTVAGTDITRDWTPNFENDDAYGSYAEFCLPVVLTALNNVLRTTESWDGQEAADAVVDDPATVDVDETAAAKPEIAPSDKPLGGDNIIPAGESWWNVNTGLREYPLKDVVSVKVHLNAKLATLQSQGWNIYTWGTRTDAPKLSALKVKSGKKFVYPYKNKVNANTTGWAFSGSDKYGAYAIVKVVRAYASEVGIIPRRSGGQGENGWGGIQSGDVYGKLAPGQTDIYLNVGSSDSFDSAPKYVGRWGARANWAAGTLTVTPVRPSHVSLKGAMPDKIVVTAKKGATVKTCEIATTAFAAENQSWSLAESCDIAVAQPANGDGTATWEIFVQGQATGVGKAVLGPTPAAKVKIDEAPAA